MGALNVEPAPGEPAMLGVEGTVSSVSVMAPIHIEVRPEDDYAVAAVATEAPETPLLAKLLGAKVTIWGVPAAHFRGDGSSNWGPGEPNMKNTLSPEPPADWKPLMQNQTSCSSQSLTTLAIDTYQAPDVFSEATASSPTPTECATVPFSPSITAEPDTTQAGAPAGLNFDLTLPQSNDPSGQGTSALEKAVVTLPQGMTVSPVGRLKSCSKVALMSSSPPQLGRACSLPGSLGDR